MSSSENSWDSRTLGSLSMESSGPRELVWHGDLYPATELPVTKPKSKLMKQGPRLCPLTRHWVGLYGVVGLAALAKTLRT